MTDGASATLVADDSHQVLIGYTTDANSLIQVAGMGSSLLLDDQSNNGLIVGDYGSGTVDVQAGATATIMGDLTLGGHTAVTGGLGGSGGSGGTGGVGGTGTIEVMGQGASLHVTGSVVIGDLGDGRIEISDSAVATFDSDVTLGAETGSNGTLVAGDAGSTVDIQGTMTVGNSGYGKDLFRDQVASTIGGDLIVGNEADGVGFAGFGVDPNALPASPQGYGGGYGGGLPLGGGLNDFWGFPGGGAFPGGPAGFPEGGVGAPDGAFGTPDGQGTTLNVGGSVKVGVAGVGEFLLEGGAAATVMSILLGGMGGASGVIPLDGQGTSLQVNNSAEIGVGGQGGVFLYGGASATFDGDVTLAVEEGSVGDIGVDGSGSTLAVGGALLVGELGQAGVIVSGGAILHATDLEIAPMAPSAGVDDPIDPETGLHAELINYVEIDDGMVSSDTLTVGGSGRGGLEMSAGTLDTTDSATIAADPGSEGEVDLSGGVWTASDITVGDGGSGLMSLADATVTASSLTIGGDGGGQGVVIVGEGASLTDDLKMHNGTLAANGGLATVNGDAEVAPDAGDKAAIVVNGGTFAMSSGTLSIGGSGNGKIAFDQAGQLVGSPDVTLGENFGGSGSMLVSDGGTSVNVGMITVGASGSGNLTVTSGATLTGSGDADLADAAVANIQGATVSNGGVWKIGTDLTVGSDGLATLMVKSGGVVDVADAVTIGDGAGAGGIATVTGTLTTGNMHTPSSLGWGTTLTVGNFGFGSLAIASGAIVAPTLGGFGAVAVGATTGGSGIVSVNGGTLDGATLDLGSAGASARLTIVSNGVVALTGDVDAATDAIAVLSGGTLAAQTVTLQAGAALNGAGWVDANVVDDGLIGAKDGDLSVSSDLSGSGSAVIQAGATLAIGGLDTLRNVRFGGAGGVLDLGDVPASGTAAIISGFAAGDTIDLTAAAGGMAGHVSGHDLIITGGGGTVATLLLSGTYTSANFDVGADASGNGTQIVLDASQPNGIPIVTPPAIGVSTPASINASVGTPQAMPGFRWRTATQVPRSPRRCSVIPAAFPQRRWAERLSPRSTAATAW